MPIPTTKEINAKIRAMYPERSYWSGVKGSGFRAGANWMKKYAKGLEKKLKNGSVR